MLGIIFLAAAPALAAKVFIDDEKNAGMQEVDNDYVAAAFNFQWRF